MKKQDFTRRIVILVNQELPAWKVLNTVGHISAHFGSHLGEEFRTQPYFKTLDGAEIPRNSQYPIIILSGSTEAIKSFSKEIESEDLEKMFFIPEMIETTDDENIEAFLSLKTKEELEYLGIGLFGENEKIKKLTQGFKLYS